MLKLCAMQEWSHTIYLTLLPHLWKDGKDTGSQHTWEVSQIPPCTFTFAICHATAALTNSKDPWEFTPPP